MIGVVGGGTMGAGIATALLVAGDDVIVIESDAERIGQVRRTIEGSLERLARRDESIGVAEALGRSNVGTDLRDTVGCSMVIEAIPEQLEMKQTLFATLETMHGNEVVFASNTSSLSITAIAESCEVPARVVGAHFFNPVPVSSLVEIVEGAQTSASTVRDVQDLVGRLGKTPILVKDSPGFASSRLGLVLGLEAIRMLESGVASAADIDTAMELGYRHPMGPLRLTDLVGLDVRLAIARHLHDELGPTFEPPPLLIDMVDEGRLGKKVGSGFFEW